MCLFILTSWQYVVEDDVLFPITTSYEFATSKLPL